METKNILDLRTRSEWRDWLKQHYDHEQEAWLLYARKATGEPRIPYNDAVEEALCFGWIDSTNKTFDKDHTIQRFTVRLPKSSYSQPNKERLKWLAEHHLIHPSFAETVQKILAEEFVFPQDILDELKKDTTAWENYTHYSASYKRIRIAYIDSARKRPKEFAKRLANFISKTHDNKLIAGFGGIDKYY